MATPTPRVITKSDPAHVSIEWADGVKTIYTPAELRRICPCAHCVNEATGERMLDPASIPDDLTQIGMRLVGNYAVVIDFSDGHHQGIYTFALLREADPARR